MITQARQHIRVALHELQNGDDVDAAVQSLVIALGNLGQADTELGQLQRELENHAQAVLDGAQVRQRYDKQRDIRMEQRSAKRLNAAAEQVKKLIPTEKRHEEFSHSERSEGLAPRDRADRHSSPSLPPILQPQTACQGA